MDRPRKCKAKNKAGEPCGATPQRESDYCCAHDTTRPESARFGSRAQAKAAGDLGGRPRLPRPTEVARRLVEENVAAILRPHFKALGLMLHDDGSVSPLDRGAFLTEESKDGEVIASAIEDLAAQIAAAEKLLDRVYGKPKQATELSGPEGGPVEVASLPSDAEWHGQVAEVLASVGAVRPAVALNGNGNGNGNHG